MYEYYMGGSCVIQNHILGMEVGEYHMLAPKTTTSYLRELQFHLLYQEGMPLSISTKENPEFCGTFADKFLPDWNFLVEFLFTRKSM